MERASYAKDSYIPLLEEAKVKHEGIEATMQGYKLSGLKLAGFIFLSIITAGLFFLLSRWLLKVRIAFLYNKCPLAEARRVMVEETVTETSVSDEKTVFLEYVENGPEGRFFVHKGLRYVFDDESGLFVCHEYGVDTTFNAIHDQCAKTATDDERSAAFTRYGPNKMSVPVPSVIELIIDELLHPFYVFQIFSVIIWILQFYLIYAGTIFVLATVALIFSVIQTRRNNLALAAMAEHKASVSLMRHGKRVMVDSEQVLPGDLVVLEQTNHLITCDMILIDGECVVNESSLTGESVPVIKSALPKQHPREEPFFSFTTHARHALFCGTELRRVKGNPIGLVVRTGYKTAKGAMIRQILYPKAAVFSFYRDALVFIVALFVLTLAAFGWAIYQFVTAGATWWFTVLRVLDLFTTVIPPALPIAMTAGASFAVYRLRQGSIFCVVPKTVNIAGRVNIMCFDKTGTLTRDHMDVFCVRPSTTEGGARFTATVKNVSEIQGSGPLVWALASCHSVVRLSQVETVGDPLEVKMMKWTKWNCSSFDEVKATMTSPDNQVIYTLVRHEFSSQLARMSVVVKAPDESLWALAKGSPEELKRHCNPRTIPADYDAILASYTAQGMRTIAIAAKPLKDASIQREEVEADLTFLGFLVMVNPLKEEATPLLDTLQNARVRVVMITGDNALTAINVARKAGMSKSGHTAMLVDCSADGELESTIIRDDTMDVKRRCSWDDVVTGADWDVAMTGAAFENLSQSPPIVMETVMRHASVFARTNPLQKARIVTSFKNIGYTVGMCGDGSNDCGALKAADAGISISDGEAAIAAPFSASNITSVKTLLLEGRCALATSFALFKFMIMYSLVQTTGVICCYVFLNLFADLQFLWVDLFLILPLSFAMGLTGPPKELVDRRPPATLFKPSVLVSLIGHAIFMIAANAGILAWAMRQPFVTPINQPTTLVNGTTPFVSVAVTVLWLFGNFLYVDYCFSFSIGYPFRLPFYYNMWLLLALVGAVVCNVVWFWVQTNPGVITFWSLVILPSSFLGGLFAGVVGFFILTYVFELLVVWLLQDREGLKEN